MRIKDCPPETILHPTDETFGYRWVYSKLHLYIITIKINGPYCKTLVAREYWTDDWTIVEIRDAIENITTDRIPGKVCAFFESDVDYYVGNHITDDSVFFCISIDDFVKSQGHWLRYYSSYLELAKKRIALSLQKNDHLEA